MANEICPRCGGQGGCPGSDFGDYGWHACYFCGATGEVPEGTAAREEENAKAEAVYYRLEYRESNYCDYEYDPPEIEVESVEFKPTAYEQQFVLSDLPF